MSEETNERVLPLICDVCHGRTDRPNLMTTSYVREFVHVCPACRMVIRRLRDAMGDKELPDFESGVAILAVVAGLGGQLAFIGKGDSDAGKLIASCPPEEVQAVGLVLERAAGGLLPDVMARFMAAGLRAAVDGLVAGQYGLADMPDAFAMRIKQIVESLPRHLLPPINGFSDDPAPEEPGERLQPDKAEVKEFTGGGRNYEVHAGQEGIGAHVRRLFADPPSPPFSTERREKMRATASEDVELLADLVEQVFDTALAPIVEAMVGNALAAGMEMYFAGKTDIYGVPGVVAQCLHSSLSMEFLLSPPVGAEPPMGIPE